jgi:heterodisulfide reductase subunit D
MLFPEKAEVLYWVGCTASYRVKETARATIDILQKAGVNYTLLGMAEGCCGSVLLRTGQNVSVEKEIAEANVEKIVATGAKTLVTSCAGCYRTFHEDYKSIIGKLPFEVLHISEYLERLINEGKVRFMTELPMKVTYHDPCHLGRHVGVYEPPRNVIKRIPGVTLTEMAKNREESRCCGAGGGLRSAYRELSIRIAADRLESDALPTGAEALVTPCPFCVLNFKDAVNTYGAKIEIIDLVELVSKALMR